uniref:Uncharacterized protein n=1 Tax=Strongyloides papillosus TaxID=174720 RepID=A0A0N5C5M2_STREA
MNRKERFIALTERLYVGYAKYVEFFEKEIERLEEELERKGNDKIKEQKQLEESSLYNSDKVNNNINYVDRALKEVDDGYEYLTNCRNESDGKINYDIKKELQVNNSITKTHIIINEYKSSCESLDKLRLENELELQKENYKIYNIYAEKILVLYYQLKEEESSVMVSSSSCNTIEKDIFNESGKLLSDSPYEDLIVNQNKNEKSTENTKLYKKSRGKLSEIK